MREENLVFSELDRITNGDSMNKKIYGIKVDCGIGKSNAVRRLIDKAAKSEDLYLLVVAPTEQACSDYFYLRDSTPDRPYRYNIEHSCCYIESDKNHAKKARDILSSGEETINWYTIIITSVRLQDMLKANDYDLISDRFIIIDEQPNLRVIDSFNSYTAQEISSIIETTYVPYIQNIEKRSDKRTIGTSILKQIEMYGSNIPQEEYVDDKTSYKHAEFRDHETVQKWINEINELPIVSGIGDPLPYRLQKIVYSLEQLRDNGGIIEQKKLFRSSQSDGKLYTLYWVSDTWSRIKNTVVFLDATAEFDYGYEGIEVEWIDCNVNIQKEQQSTFYFVPCSTAKGKAPKDNVKEFIMSNNFDVVFMYEDMYKYLDGYFERGHYVQDTKQTNKYRECGKVAAFNICYGNSSMAVALTRDMQIRTGNYIDLETTKSSDLYYRTLNNMVISCVIQTMYRGAIRMHENRKYEFYQFFDWNPDIWQIAIDTLTEYFSERGVNIVWIRDLKKHKQHLERADKVQEWEIFLDDKYVGTKNGEYARWLKAHNEIPERKTFRAWKKQSQFSKDRHCTPKEMHKTYLL